MAPHAIVLIVATSYPIQSFCAQIYP
jgi:hypothetical protein